MTDRLPMQQVGAAGFLDPNYTAPGTRPPVVAPSFMDQPILVSAGYDKMIKFWHVASAQTIHQIAYPDSQINSLAVNDGRDRLAAAGYQKIRLFDLCTGQQPLDFEGASKNVTVVGFEQDAKWMFTGSEDNKARIWDLRTKQLSCQRIFMVNTAVNSVCLHPNQVEVFVGDASGTLYSWDLRNNANEQTALEPPSTPTSINHVAVDPDGTKLAVVTNRGTAYMWSLVSSSSDVVDVVNENQPISAQLNQTQTDATMFPPAAIRSTKFIPKKKFQVHETYALRCAFSPDSTLLASTSADQTARIWTTADFSELIALKKTPEMKEDMKWVWDCAFTRDSQHLFTCSSDGAIRFAALLCVMVQALHVWYGAKIKRPAFSAELSRQVQHQSNIRIADYGI